MDRSLQAEIIRRTTGLDPERVERFKNPFRLDPKPGCFFQWYKGYLRLVDNGDRKYFNMNCWDMVMEKHNCDFKEAKRIVSSWGLDPNMATKVDTPQDDFKHMNS